MRLVVDRCIKHKHRDQWRCRFLRVDKKGNIRGVIESTLPIDPEIKNANAAIQAALAQIRKNAWEWDGKPRYTEVLEVRGRAFDVTEEEIVDLGLATIEQEES